MNDIGEKKQNNSIIKFVGRPTILKDKSELTRWKRFLKFIWPWAKEGGKLIARSKQLTEDFYQAEVIKKTNEADKFAAEASNIAAERELKIQQKVRVVNDEIAKIFSDNNVPDIAKQLQLANLIANNPEIASQLNKIDELVTKLKVVNFSKFKLEIEEGVKPGLEIENNEETNLKEEPSEEEIQKHVRETLEKLGKQKKD